MLMHKWATARDSGGPRTSVYFEIGFACRIRLRNTGPYKQLYGPVPVNWKSYDLLFGNQLRYHVVKWPFCKLEKR